MSRQSVRAREALLDAAEELYAKHGIDAVSSRRITEYAGGANHSAITYHFGSRDGLLRALIERSVAVVNPRRQQMMDELDDDAQVRQVIACRILPWVEHLGQLPVPSWRARFLYQVRAVPSVSQVLTDSLQQVEDFEGLNLRTGQRLEGISAVVLRARSGIMGHLVLGLCAQYEQRVNEGAEQSDWMALGYFMLDSCVGMISAPSTQRSDFSMLPLGPTLI